MFKFLKEKINGALETINKKVKEEVPDEKVEVIEEKVEEEPKKKEKKSVPKKEKKQVPEEKEKTEKKEEEKPKEGILKKLFKKEKDVKEIGIDEIEEVQISSEKIFSKLKLSNPYFSYDYKRKFLKNKLLSLASINSIFLKEKNRNEEEYEKSPGIDL